MKIRVNFEFGSCKRNLQFNEVVLLLNTPFCNLPVILWQGDHI